jgi:hypothetical protein
VWLVVFKEANLSKCLFFYQILISKVKNYEISYFFYRIWNFILLQEVIKLCTSIREEFCLLIFFDWKPTKEKNSACVQERNFFSQNFIETGFVSLLYYSTKISLKEACIFFWSGRLKSTLEGWQRLSTLFEAWLFALVGCRFVNIKHHPIHIYIRKYFPKFCLGNIGKNMFWNFSHLQFFTGFVSVAWLFFLI